MSFSYLWPIVLVIISNVVYNITTKNTPHHVNSFLSLAITYIVGAIISMILYFCTVSSIDIITELRRLNWTTYILGFAIIGLETGYIYLYRAGWNISTGSLVANITLAVILLFVGIIFYKEIFGWQQIVGITLCIAGLVMINSH